MELNREQAIDILERFDFFQGQRAGRELWNDKPFDVQEADIAKFSQDVALLKNYIKELTAEVEQFRYEHRKLIGARDTFREYAYNMQKYVENIKHKEEAGYEPSAARYAAEMDMWHAIALRENELIEDSREKDKTISNLIETIKSIQADTVRKMQERLNAQKFTHKNFGELVYVEDIDQIAKEMLEGE